MGIGMTCSLLLGASSYWQENFMSNFGITFRWISVQVVGQLIEPVFSAGMLEMMVFVTPPLNDLGDIKGDKKAGRQAGRRTIPIVLGKENNIPLSTLITLDIVFRHGFLTGTCVLLIFHLLNLVKRTEDQEHIMESVGKKVNAYALTITALAGYWLLHAPMRPMSQ